MPAPFFFVSGGDEQMNGHRVEQLVRKVDARKTLHLFERPHPFRLFHKRPQDPLLALPQNGKRFDNPVAYHSKKSRMHVAKRFQNIRREFAVMRPLFYDYEVSGLAKFFPNFRELPRHQHSKQRPHADTREVVAPSSDLALAGAVIAMLRMV